MKRFLAKVFKFHYFLATFFVYGFIGLFAVISFNSEFLNPLAEAFNDFEITDVVFSKLKNNEEIKPDTNIVLINIGTVNRAGIAKMVDIVNSCQPKLIGIDAFFRQPRSPVRDSLLSSSFSKVKNLILVSQVTPERFNKTTGMWDSLEHSHPMFNQYATTGLSNFITDWKGKEKFKICRSFSAYEKIKNGHTEYAFGIEVAKKVYPEKTKKFLERNNQVEIINFERNIPTGYLAFDVPDIFSPDMFPILERSLKDKIVLMGYMGQTLDNRSWEDKFYTPLNNKFAGKALPDMFGVVVHANIISMIYNESFINRLPSWIAVLIGVIFCYINIVYFFRIKNKLPTWYDLITKTIQLLETIVIVYVVLQIFAKFNYKIDLDLGLLAIVLSGDLLEVYSGGLTNIFKIIKSQIKKTFN